LILYADGMKHRPREREERRRLYRLIVEHSSPGDNAYKQAQSSLREMGGF
jgi:hypothetical protein